MARKPGMPPRYKVTLTQKEREELEALTKERQEPQPRVSCTHGPCCCAMPVAGAILGLSPILPSLSVSPLRTIEHLDSTAFVEEGIEAALQRSRGVLHQKLCVRWSLSGVPDYRPAACSPGDPKRAQSIWMVFCGSSPKKVQVEVKDRLQHLAHDRPASAKKNEFKPHLSKY